MPVTWSRWPWLSMITSTSLGAIPSRRMFSTMPPGETPVSNSSVRSCPPFSIRTSAENPGSAISASGTPRSGLTRAGAAGRPPINALGQLTRVTACWSASSGSVTLSNRELLGPAAWAELLTPNC